LPISRKRLDKQKNVAIVEAISARLNSLARDWQPSSVGTENTLLRKVAEQHIGVTEEEM
jgi:hypothetical protein